MRRLDSIAANAQDISAARLVATYTADADRALLISVLLGAVAGDGDYECYITRQLAGTGSAYQVGPVTTFAVAAGVTRIGFTSILIPAADTDVIRVYLLGQAGDTAVDIITEIYELAYLRPTVAGRTLDVSASGEAGVDWANVGSASTPVDLSNTLIKEVSVTLAEGEGAKVADDVWGAASRTLTSVAVVDDSGAPGADITCIIATTLSVTWSGLSIPNTWKQVFFTVKRYLEQADSAAALQVHVSNPTDKENDGLDFYDGAAAGANKTKAALVVDVAAGTVVLLVEDDVTLLIPKQRAYYDLKVLMSAGASYLLAEGIFEAVYTPTKSIAIVV